MGRMGPYKPSARHADIVRETAHSGNAAATSPIAASWRRSLLHHGLEPETSHDIECVTEQELLQTRDRLGQLLDVAKPTLDHLFSKVSDCGCCVVLTDNSGIILERRNRAADEKTFGQWGLRKGAIWSEELEGTNGIGTCLAEDRPVTIQKDQHFHSRNTDLSCVDAPIYDHNGTLVAALDVSICSDTLPPMMMNLISCAVFEAARKIETDNFHACFPNARIIMCQEQGQRGSALLATDQDDLIIGANRAARKAYGLSNEALSCPLPAEDILSGDVRSSDLKNAERAELRRALARTNGNVSAAAKMLGLGRATIYRRMKRLGISG